MTKAAELLSPSTRRRSGIATPSTSAWLSIPQGPWASVSQTISGPPSKPSGFKASSSPWVTRWLELGLMTRMRGRDIVFSCGVTHRQMLWDRAQRDDDGSNDHAIQLCMVYCLLRKRKG